MKNMLSTLSIAVFYGAVSLFVNSCNIMNLKAGGSSAPVEESWSPDDASATIVFWYRGDSIVSGADWQDLGPGNIDLAQADGAKQPTVGTAALNGHDSMIFDGSNDYMVSSATFTITRPYHIFGVMRIITYHASNYVNLDISASGVGNRIMLYSWDNGGVDVFSFNPTPADINATIDPAEGTFFFFEALGKSGSNNTKIVINDGTPATGTLSADPAANTLIALGARYNGVNPSAVEWVEVICYSSELSVSDQAEIVNYFQTRYGL